MLADAGVVGACVDGDWYLKTYPDVAAHGSDPVEHYLRTGWHEDRKPNVVFDPIWYRQQSLRGASNTREALLAHYCSIGEPEGLSPSAWFDPVWYRATYRLMPDQNCLQHYLRHRHEAEIHPHPLFDVPAGQILEVFDPPWYLATYEDVARHRIDPFTHYQLYGWQEDRWPNPCFDPVWYKSQIGDFADADANPLHHYLLAGEPQGHRPVEWFDAGWHAAAFDLADDQSALLHYLQRRKTHPVAPNRFLDPVYYRQKIQSGEAYAADPHDHYLKVGRQHGMLPMAEATLLMQSGLFDEDYYVFNNPAVLETGIAAVSRFLRDGRAKAVRPNPYFDPQWYAARKSQDAMSALADYFLHGEPRNSRPSLYFDTAWYRKTHRIRSYDSPLAHYLRHRHTQTVSPNPLFDVAFYIATYGHDIPEGRDPFIHYLCAGSARDFRPASWFDVTRYKQDHMATADRKLATEARHNPLLHLLLTRCLP